MQETSPSIGNPFFFQVPCTVLAFAARHSDEVSLISVQFLMFLNHDSCFLPMRHLPNKHEIVVISSYDVPQVSHFSVYYCFQEFTFFTTCMLKMNLCTSDFLYP